MKAACKIRQRDLTDCGVACLASVAAFHGLHVPVGRLRQYASTDQHGTNIIGLIQAAEKLSLFAKGLKGEPSNLAQLPLPFIAHVVENQLQHYIVIFKVSKKNVIYMDPADGKYHKQTLSAFQQKWTGILLLVVPQESFQKADVRQSPYHWYWQLIRPHRFLIVQSILAAVIYTVLGLAPSLYIQKIVDFVLPDQNVRLLNLLTVIMVGCLLIQLIIGYLKSLFVLHTGQHLDARLILGYYKHLLRLPQTFFDSMQVGEIVSRVNDAVKIRSFINNTGVEMLLNLFIIQFSLFMMLLYNWKMALLVSIIFPGYIAIYFISNYTNRKWSRRLMEKAAKVETDLVETVSSIRTIKRFASEEYINLKMQAGFLELLRTVFTSSNKNSFVVIASEALLRLVSICMLCVGSYFVFSNQLSIGELLSFYSLLAYFTLPASALISANRNLQEAAIAGERLLDIIDLDTEPTSDGRVHLTRDMVGDIVFKDVAFKYGTRRELFSGLSMKIAKGRATAIVGESGSGKSTLLSLLHNVYIAQSGTIRIGTFSLKNISNESLRTCISVVPQEIQLLSGTIAENIAFGIYEPDMERLLNLSQLLGLDTFIEALPNGYHHFLGEQGMSLSGGQRQRLAIARALYRQPAILLLDEATAALDASTERKVQEALNWYLKQGNTLIIVAHRLSTIRNCDDIKVLKDGKLLEEGSHEELIKLDGYYKTLWRESQDCPI